MMSHFSAVAALLLLSLTLRAQQNSDWTPTKTYTDPAHGVTFQYPAGWRPAHRNDSMDGPNLLATDIKPTFAVDDQPGGFYANTDLEAVYFVYAVKPASTKDACDDIVHAVVGPDSLPSVTVHGVKFAVHNGGDASAGHSSWGNIYTTFLNHNCYLFETNTAAASVGLLDNARSLTKRDFDRIDAHLLAIMRTVQIALPSIRSATDRLTIYRDPDTGVSFRFSAAWKQSDPQSGKGYSDEGWAIMPQNSDDAPKRPRSAIVFSPGARYTGTVFRELAFIYAVEPAPDLASCLKTFHAEESGDPPDAITINGRKFQEFSVVNVGACRDQSDTADVTFTDGRCIVFDRQTDTSCPDPTQTGRELTSAEQQALDSSVDRILQSVRIQNTVP